MRTKLATYALAGALGLTGVAGAALVAPAVSYAATGDSTALESRVSSIRQGLTGLVSDGTITQSQADQVATTLAQARSRDGHGRGGGPGKHLDALSSLGITAEELRAAAEAGTTLADLAAQQGVSEDAVVEALVAAGEERLAQAVADGRLTQAQADERSADLQARITERLDQPVRAGRRGNQDRPAPDASTASPTA